MPLSRSLKRVLNALLHRIKVKQTLPRIVGYENPILVLEIIRKTLARRDELGLSRQLNISELRTLVGFTLAKLNGHSRIIDFGGGAGTHFDSLHHLYPELDLEYIVIETPLMCSLASKARSDNNHLRFLTLSELSKVTPKPQLLIANSSLQYTDNPLSTLTKLLTLSPEHVFITRCPLNQGKGEILINQVSRLSDNGPTATGNSQELAVEYTARIASYEDFKESLEKQYRILLEIKEEHAPFGINYPDVDSWGFFCIAE